MNGPPPSNANAPTEGPRRSNDDGYPEDNTTEHARQYKVYSPGSEPLRDVLRRVLGRIGGREVAS